MNKCHSRLMLLTCWAVILHVAAACSKPGPDAAASATLPVPAMTVTLSSGSTLGSSISPDLRSDFQLIDPEVIAAPLIFANGRYGPQADRTPFIVRNADEHWKALPLSSFQDAEWVYAGTAIRRGEIWAILYSASNARALGLYLLRSTNGGETWTLFSAIKLPAPTVEFLCFSLDAKGAGSVTVHQEDDTAAFPRGLYTFRTADSGKTWTGPAYTPDDLFAADQSTFSLQETIKDIRRTPFPTTLPAPQPLIIPPSTK